MQKEEKNQKNILEEGTYEIIQSRLQKQKEELQNRLGKLNQERAKVFGSVETKLYCKRFSNNWRYNFVWLQCPFWLTNRNKFRRRF